MKRGYDASSFGGSSELRKRTVTDPRFRYTPDKAINLHSIAEQAFFKRFGRSRRMTEDLISRKQGQMNWCIRPYLRELARPDNLDLFIEVAADGSSTWRGWARHADVMKWAFREMSDVWIGSGPLFSMETYPS
jgi:hypothetical protein